MEAPPPTRTTTANRKKNSILLKLIIGKYCPLLFPLSPHTHPIPIPILSINSRLKQPKSIKTGLLCWDSCRTVAFEGRESTESGRWEGATWQALAAASRHFPCLPEPLRGHQIDVATVMFLLNSAPLLIFLSRLQ